MQEFSNINKKTSEAFKIPVKSYLDFIFVKMQLNCQ